MLDLKMMPDTEEGLLHELAHILPADWTLHKVSGRFQVSVPETLRGTPDIHQRLRAQTWKIAQFVAYAHFVSIERRPDGSFLIQSRRDENEGFEIVVDPVPSILPDQRPKLVIEQ